MRKYIDLIQLLVLLVGLSVSYSNYFEIQIKYALFFILISIIIIFHKPVINFKDPLIYLVFLLLIYRIIQIFISDFKISVIREIVYDIGMIVFSIYTANYFQNKEIVKNFGVFIILFGLLCIIMGFIRFGFMDFGGAILFSSFGNKNFLGAFVIFIFPVLLMYLLYCINNRRIIKIGIFTFTGIILLYSLFEIESKGAFLGFIVSILFFIIFILYTTRALWLKPSYKIYIFIFVSLFFIYFFTSPMGEKFVKSFGYVGTSAFRIDTYRTTLDMIQENFLKGTGRGTFRIIYPGFRPIEVLKFEHNINNETVHTHNEYLEVLVEEGVIGLSLFVSIILLIIYRIFKFHCKNKEVEVIRKGFIFGFIAYMSHNATCVNFRYIQNNIFFWLILGMALSIFINPGIEQEARSKKQEARKIISVILSIFVIIFAVSNLFLSDFYLGEAVRHSRNNDYDTAKKLYETTLRLDKNYIEALYFYGTNEYDRNNYNSSLNIYYNLKNLAPYFVMLPYRIGLCYEKLGNREKMASFIQKYLKIYPLYPAGLTKLAFMYYEAGEKEKAMRLFEKAMKLDPLSPDYRNNYANALYFLGDLQTAITQYQFNIMLNPGYVDGLLNLAEIYRVNNMLKESFILYRKVVELDPQNQTAISRLQSLGSW
ncbi:MAG: O-antigen ligase family protein [Candidatus Hydrogenedentota bacterium]